MSEATPVETPTEPPSDDLYNSWNALRALVKGIVSYDRENMIASDARARVVKAKSGMLSVQIDMMTGRTSDIFDMQGREARVLAASLLRASDEYDRIEDEMKKPKETP